MTERTAGQATENDVLQQAADHAKAFRAGLDDRPVRPEAGAAVLRERLAVPLPAQALDAVAVIDGLVEATRDAVVAMAGPRYFGFVIGGSLPVAVAADWLTSAWDQNAGLFVGGPAAAIVEEVAGAWMLDLLGLPPHASYAFVTGCQMAHVTALAAARHHLLSQASWDLQADGLAGSPPIRVLASRERHVTIDRALRLLGIGTSAVTPIDTDDQGRMRSAALAEAIKSGSGPTLVCAQVGNIDTGSCDPVAEIIDQARNHDAWVHVDGAFGLWAAAASSTAGLVAGHAGADSWATDAHKWLNVPYDSGFAAVAHPEAHQAAMAVRAPYLEYASGDRPPRDQVDWTPEFSRRARGFAVYAALRHLGRAGVADLVERLCARAQQFARHLDGQQGAVVLNEVVLNQVLVDFGSAERNQAIVTGVQEEGTCWVSGTTWRGRSAIRISVSGWSTTEQDVDRSADAILRVAAATV